MTDEGGLLEYLGVKIKPLKNGTIKLSQPHVIDQILNNLGFKENTTIRHTPASTTMLLYRDPDGDLMDKDWEYQSVVGKLNFLEKSTRCDLSYAVHQCTRFSSDLKRSHAEAVKHIGRYLVKTRDKGIILDPRGHVLIAFSMLTFQVLTEIGQTWSLIQAQPSLVLGSKCCMVVAP